MKVASKLWVVTGGGSGMGRELVLQLLGRDARVAAVDRNPAGLLGIRDPNCQRRPSGLDLGGGVISQDDRSVAAPSHASPRATSDSCLDVGVPRAILRPRCVAASRHRVRRPLIADGRVVGWVARVRHSPFTRSRLPSRLLGLADQGRRREPRRVRPMRRSASRPASIGYR